MSKWSVEYYYEGSGTIVVEAESEKQAEEIVGNMDYSTLPDYGFDWTAKAYPA